MGEPTCAVWYWCHLSVNVEFCEGEDEAARFAVSLDDSETGATEGIQYSDGRFVRREEWQAYKAEDERRMQAWLSLARQQDTRTTARLKPPFEARGTTATTYDEVPSWLKGSVVT